MYLLYKFYDIQRKHHCAYKHLQGHTNMIFLPYLLPHVLLAPVASLVSFEHT